MTTDYAYRVVWRGNVQGIGFRATVRKCCFGQSIRGWVRNRRDGVVEALLVGTANGVDAVMTQMRALYPTNIHDVTATPTAPQDPLPATLEIWPTA